MMSKSPKRAVRKWTVKEDEKLRQAVAKERRRSRNSAGNLPWNLIAEKIPNRDQSRCRERWYNNLDLSVNRGPWKPKEDALIRKLYKQKGSKWVEITQQLNATLKTNRTSDLLRRHAAKILRTASGSRKKGSKKRKAPPQHNTEAKRRVRPRKVKSKATAVPVVAQQPDPRGRPFLGRAAKGLPPAVPCPTKASAKKKAPIKIPPRSTPPRSTPAVAMVSPSMQDEDHGTLSSTWRRQLQLRRRGEWRPTGGWTPPRWAVPQQSDAAPPATIMTTTRPNSDTSSKSSDQDYTPPPATNIHRRRPRAPRQGPAPSVIVRDLIAKYMPVIETTEPEIQATNQKSGQNNLSEKGGEDDATSSSSTAENETTDESGGQSVVREKDDETDTTSSPSSAEASSPPASTVNDTSAAAELPQAPKRSSPKARSLHYHRSFSHQTGKLLHSVSYDNEDDDANCGNEGSTPVDAPASELSHASTINQSSEDVSMQQRMAAWVSRVSKSVLRTTEPYRSSLPRTQKLATATIAKPHNGMDTQDSLSEYREKGDDGDDDDAKGSLSSRDIKAPPPGESKVGIGDGDDDKTSSQINVDQQEPTSDAPTQVGVSGGQANSDDDGKPNFLNGNGRKKSASEDSKEGDSSGLDDEDDVQTSVSVASTMATTSTSKVGNRSLKSVRYPSFITPTPHLLKQAHAAMHELLPEGDCEDLEVLRLAVSYYDYWRPERGKTRVILLAESHAFTGADRALRGPGLDGRFLADSYDGPRNFVSLVYCLAYGEDQALAETAAVGGDAGKGTPQFWSLLAACSRGTEKPTEPANDRVAKSKFSFAADVLKMGGLSVEDRLAAKLSILQDLKARGIWLIDTSLFGWYISQPQKYRRSAITNEVHRLQKERPPKALKAPALVMAWEMYTKHVIRQAAEEGSLQLLVPIGMEVEASLTRERLEDAVNVGAGDDDDVDVPRVAEAFPAPNAWIPGGYGPFFTKLSKMVHQVAPPISN